MAAPPPSSVPKTEAVGYPVFNPPTTTENWPREHKPHFPYGSNPQPQCVCRLFDGFMPEVRHMCILLAATLALLLAMCALGAMAFAFCVFASIVTGPSFPLLRVAGMTMSTDAVNTSAGGTTWRASILVEVPGIFWGDLYIHEIESYIYNNSNKTQPLALASVGSFRLQSNQRIVMKAIMKMETPEKALVDETERSQRSTGTAVVGLGFRMQGTYVFKAWKRNYGYTEAYCKNLTIAFSESTGEGSLVHDDSLALDNDLASDVFSPINYLPACSYGTNCWFC